MGESRGATGNHMKKWPQIYSYVNTNFFLQKAGWKIFLFSVEITNGDITWGVLVLCGPREMNRKKHFLIMKLF